MLSRRRPWAALVLCLSVLTAAVAACKDRGIDLHGENATQLALEPEISAVTGGDEMEGKTAPDLRPFVPDEVPPLDTTLHSVPLSEIYFDTFRTTQRAVPLDRASPDLIASLLDAIPPLHSPEYEPAAAASWLQEEDLVLGYASGDQAWAFPVRILNYHEIVNDVLDGEPLLISYCPLCYSGVVYSRRLNDSVLTFGNTSALYESDMVMLDYGTGSYWWQVAGAAIVGPLTGELLAPRASQMTSWQSWRDQYPTTKVLSRDTGFGRNYSRDPFAGYDRIVDQGGFAFPVSEATKDERLRPAARVLAVRVGEAVRAYSLETPVVTVYAETLAGQPVVVWVDPAAPTGAAFSPVLDGQTLTFVTRGAAIVDVDTESTWDFGGRARTGVLAGRQLEALPSKTSFWFAIVAAEPTISVATP